MTYNQQTLTASGKSAECWPPPWCEQLRTDNENLRRDNEKLTEIFEFARREFIDAAVKYPELAEWSEGWVKRIGRLYHLNNQRINYEQETKKYEKYDKKLRKKITEIEALSHQKYDHPGKKAVIDSMKKHWTGLTVFIDNPEVDMASSL